MNDYKPSSMASPSYLGPIIWFFVLLGVFACLPGMMSGNYLPKTFWAAAMIGLGFLLIPSRYRHGLNLTPLGSVWLLYLLWAIISISWAPQPRVGLERWMALLLPTMAYLLAGRTRFWESGYFWSAFSILAGLVALIGVLQYFLSTSAIIHIFPGTAVPRSTLGSRNYASMYLMATFPFVLRHYFQSRGTRTVIPFISIIFIILFLLLAKTRGAWLGLLLGFGYLLAAGGYRFILLYRRKLIFLFLPSCLAFILAVTVGLPSGSERSFKNKYKFIETVGSLLNPQQRMSFWKPCLGITDPVLGSGFGNFPIVATPFLRRAEVKTLNWEVHNDYLQAYVDLGIPGAVLFILFFVFLLRLAWKGRGKGLFLAAGASVVGLAVMQFTTFTSEKISTQIWFAGVAAILNYKPGSKPMFRINTPSWLLPGLNYLVAAWLFLYAIAIGYTIRGDKEFRKERGRIEKVLSWQKILDDSTQYSKSEREYIREEGLYDRIKIQSRLNWLANHIIPTMFLDANMKHISCHQFAGLAMRLKNYDAAKLFAEEALYLHPTDRTSLRYLTEIAFLRNNYQKARQFLERGIKTFGFSPQAPYFVQMLINLNRSEGRYVEASAIEAAMDRNRVSKPADPFPSNLSTGVPVDIIFDWSDSNAADSYEVYLWGLGEEEPQYPTMTNLSKSRGVLKKPLKPGKTYLWRVRALGRYGELAGDIWVFQTKR